MLGQAESPANYNANYIFGIAGGRLAGDFEDTATGLNHPVCTATTQPTITTGAWHHAAATYNGTCWALYLDGVALPIDTACSTCSGGACTVCPGATPEYTSIQHFGLGTTLNTGGTAAGFYKGQLDEVRVWNYPRTAAQILGTKDRQVESASGLIGRWGLNEKTGVRADDSTIPNEFGTLTNGPVWKVEEIKTFVTNECVHDPIPNCCHVNADCDDGLWCTGTETCDPLNNVCIPGTAPNCNDGVGCTTDACNDTTDTCTHTANNSLCSDGLLCTDDVCNVLTGCQYPVNTVACNDGNPCTVLDACSLGSCVGQIDAACCLADAACDEGNVCTTDTCNKDSASIPLNGTSQYLTAAPAVTPNDCSSENVDYLTAFGTNSFTIEGWFKANSITDNASIFRQGRQGTRPQVVVQVRGTGVLGSVESCAAGQIETAVVGFNTAYWHHFALVVNRATSQVILYVDGVKGTPVTTSWASSTKINNATVNAGDPVLIGVARAEAGTLTPYFNGSVDEIRIWSKALSDAEIVANMNRQVLSARTSCTGGP